MITQAHPGVVEWNQPETLSNGVTLRAVDDTTASIAEYYRIGAGLVDLLDEFDRDRHPLDELCELVARAGYPDGNGAQEA